MAHCANCGIELLGSMKKCPKCGYNTVTGQIDQQYLDALEKSREKEPFAQANTYDVRFDAVIRGKYGNGDGTIEINRNEMIVFRKSAFTRALFGQVGVALSSGKEVGRFFAVDIAFIEVKEYVFRSVVYYVFKDNSKLSISIADERAAKVKILKQFASMS